jgi:hypothetical protein
MASVYESWKLLYSEDEYNKKVIEYKEKLRRSAKANKFGCERVYVKVTCTKCFCEYLGVANQLICNDCKSSGYSSICKHCGEEFLKLRHSNCCDTCFKLQPWKRKVVTEEQKKKFRKTKLLWYTTTEGIEHRKKMSKFNSENMKRFNQTPAGKENIRKKALKLSRVMKDKILNGTFTPVINNARTHWDAKIILSDGTFRKFRSSWEAVFWASNVNLEYEKFRIPWYDLDGVLHTYISDFYDPVNRIIYEIKPECHYILQERKMSQAIDFCIKNNIQFIWVNEMNILNYINQEFEIYHYNDNNKQQLNKVINASRKNTNKID